MGGVVCVNELPVIELLRNSRRSVCGAADAVVVNRLPTTHAHRGLLAPLHAGGHCTVQPGNIAWANGAGHVKEMARSQPDCRLGELDVVSATEMSPTVEIYYPLSIYTYIGFALFSN